MGEGIGDYAKGIRDWGEGLVGAKRNCHPERLS